MTTSKRPTETLPDGTTAVRVEHPSFQLGSPQVYRHNGKDRVVRFTGKCVTCGTRCYSHDDGGDDPRGVLGDHADSSMTAEENDMVGPDVVQCFACANWEPSYRRARAIGKQKWREKPERIVVDLTAHRVEPEAFWEPARIGDGYDRMDDAAKRGWHAVSSWGRDGWDFLEWPYYVGYTRTTPEGFEFATNCEGDVDVYRFATDEERTDAMDRLAFWHWQAKGREWVDGVYPDAIPDHLRGRYSPNRPE